MAQYIDKSALVAKIKGYISNYKEIVAKISRNDSTWVDSVSMIESKIGVLQHLLAFLDTLEVKEVQEESVSEDLEEAARDILDTYKPVFNSSTSDGEPIEYYSPGQMRTIFMKGSYWQKEHCLRGLMTSDLETAADKYAIKTYNMYIKDETTLNNKEGDEILSDAFKAGANWGRNQAKVEIQAQSMALAHGCPKEEPVSEDLEEVASRYAKEEYNRKSPATLPDRCRGCYAPLIYAFKAGAKWQNDKACKWLKENKDHPLIGCEDRCLSGYLTDGFIEDFQKAMEE